MQGKQIHNPVYSTGLIQITSPEYSTENFDLVSLFSQEKKLYHIQQTGCTAWITNTEHLHKPQSNLQHVIQLQRLLRKMQPTGRCCIKRHGRKIQVSNWFSFNIHTANEDYFHSPVSDWDCFPRNMYSLCFATERLSVSGNSMQRSVGGYGK